MLGSSINQKSFPKAQINYLNTDCQELDSEIGIYAGAPRLSQHRVGYHCRMEAYNVAQINVGRLVAPVDDPRIAEFVAQLEPINKLADSSPGFVWRLQSDQGNATDLAYNDDPFVLVNMSVWESIEALQAFTYKSQHLHVLRDRKKWFERMELPHYCLCGFPLAIALPSRRGEPGSNTINAMARHPRRFGSLSGTRCLRAN
jgi:Domain of unknown function (DUF3291)